MYIFKYRRLFFALLLFCSLVSQPVKANSNYSDHPYDIFENYLLGFVRQSPLNQQGFGNLSEGFNAINYYSSLALSKKKTPKGYSYAECNFSFYYSLDLRSYSPKDTYQDENFGFYFNYQYDLSFSSGEVKIGSSRAKKYTTSFDFLKDYNEDLNNGLTHQEKWYSHYIKYYTNHVRVKTRLNKNKFIELGCDKAPVEEKSSDCPNLIIRGLPFIRNTITCHQKNR